MPNLLQKTEWSIALEFKVIGYSRGKLRLNGVMALKVFDRTIICTVLALLSSALFVEPESYKSYSGLLPMREHASRWIKSSTQVCCSGIQAFDKSLLAWEQYSSSQMRHSAYTKYSD